MIRFEHVSKAYLGGRQALQGVTFHMQPGEMAFLTGHSGAGKSTLLKLICGIERPSAGKIWFSGHDITRLKNREVPFLRRQIGMIFQDHHLLMDRTVYDNVAIPLIIAGASGDDIRRRVSAALDKVGLLENCKLPTCSVIPSCTASTKIQCSPAASSCSMRQSLCRFRRSRKRCSS